MLERAKRLVTPFQTRENLSTLHQHVTDTNHTKQITLNVANRRETVGEKPKRKIIDNFLSKVKPVSYDSTTQSRAPVI